MKRQALHSKSLTFYHPILERDVFHYKASKRYAEVWHIKGNKILIL